MGVKYRAEFQDINAVDWRIDIDEAGYSGTINTFTVAAPGFTATWEGDGAKVGESPIRASKAVVHWLVRNSTEETFLDTLAISGWMSSSDYTHVRNRFPQKKMCVCSTYDLLSCQKGVL
jgi:hypothetical protein